jgi:hypothetical protein
VYKRQASDSLSIQVENPPVVNAGQDQSIQYGTATQLSGSASGGSGDYSYLWSPENLVTDPGSPATNTVALEQSVQFILHVDDNISGCSKTDAVVVTVIGGPLSVDALADPDHICSGEKVDLLALVSGGSGSYVYSWTSEPHGFTADSASPVAYPEVTTMYFTEVTDGIESARDSVLVLVETVPDAPGEITGPMTVCAGDQGILYEIDPVPGATHYLWTLGNGMYGSSDSTSILVGWDDNFSGAGGSIGVRSVNECGISDEESWIAPVVKKIPDVPQAIIGPDSLCITTDSIVVYRLEESAQWADDYEWQVIPEDAGYLVPDGMEASMHWAPDWEGEVLILARATNICFQSEWSDPLAVWAFNCLGIRDPDREGVKLFIYPNPADEVLGVRCYVSGEHVMLDVFIFDLFGRKVLETSHPGRGSIAINTSGIPAGMYILSLRGGNGLMVSTRIVIQH